MDKRRELPRHPLPDGLQAAGGAIRVDGLVAQPRELGAAELTALRRADLFGPFSCEEGWQVDGLAWRGVRLADVIALAQRLSAATWVRVHAGNYVVPLSLEEAEIALLCDELNGAPLAVEHGAPWRLIMPGASCFTSVKWVDRVELAAEPGEQTGRDIARSRLAAATGPAGTPA